MNAQATQRTKTLGVLLMIFALVWTIAPLGGTTIAKAEGEAIVLPKGFGMEQAMPVEDLEEILATSGYAFAEGEGGNAAEGSPAGAYTKDQAEQTRIYLIAYVDGTEAMYGNFASLAVPESTIPIVSTLWDQGMLADFADGSTGFVALKGDTVLAGAWFADQYPDFDRQTLGAKILLKLISNLYGIDAVGTEVKVVGDVSDEAQAAEADSPVPDALPEDLGGLTKYGYIMALMKDYVPNDVFSNPAKYDVAARVNARRALKLIIAVCTDTLDKGVDVYTLHLRGRAYAAKYLDTKDVGYKEMALADFKAALDKGFTVAQPDYDKVKTYGNIVLPKGWTLAKALSPEEMAAALGVNATFRYQEGDDSKPEKGKPSAVYGLMAGLGAMSNQIYVLADVEGGSKLYKSLQKKAVEGTLEEVAGIGDQAFLCGLAEAGGKKAPHTALVALYGDLVVQVQVPTDAWKTGSYATDPEQLVSDIAYQLLDNLTNPFRAVP